MVGRRRPKPNIIKANHFLLCNGHVVKRFLKNIIIQTHFLYPETLSMVTIGDFCVKASKVLEMIFVLKLQNLSKSYQKTFEGFLGKTFNKHSAYNNLNSMRPTMILDQLKIIPPGILP